jgi:hypothetical protein
MSIDPDIAITGDLTFDLGILADDRRDIIG